MPAGSDNGPLTLQSHIPNVVQRSLRQDRMEAQSALTLQVALPLRDEEGLDATLAAMYDPHSPSFHQFLTPDTFAAAHHPVADDVNQVREALEGANMQVTGVHGAFIEVQTTADDAERFFSTELFKYTSSDGQNFHAPSGEVTVPAGLPIRAVHGLSGGLLHRSHRAAVAARAPRPTAGLTPALIHQVYNIPTTLTGSGQSIGLFEFDGYTKSDISGYENAYSLAVVPLTNIFIDNFNGQPGQAADEVTLDIEMMAAVAPGADEIRVYEQSGTGSDVDMLNEIANPTQGDKKLISIISCSFGNAEDQATVANLQSDNILLKQMASQGQTFFDASGDAGALDDGQTLSIDEYAGQPYVIGVGGTTLTQTSGTYGSETTWVGGGGGISSVWPIPTWQANVLSTAAKGSTTKRNVPDVALDADPNTGYQFYFQGSLAYGGGGTSFASPLWAAFLALVAEQRATNGVTPIGFLAPSLYALGGSSAYAGAMHDIADNSTNGFYPAVKAYDNATGWGSINGVPLIAALAAGATSSGTGGTTSGGAPGAAPAAGAQSSGVTGVPNSGTSCADAGAQTFVCLAAAALLVRPRRRFRAP